MFRRWITTNNALVPFRMPQSPTLVLHSRITETNLSGRNWRRRTPRSYVYAAWKRRNFQSSRNSRLGIAAITKTS